VLATTAFLAGCGPGVHGSAPDRARDTVQSFASACARGEWPAAVGVLTEGTRHAFLEQSDPVQACGTVLGVRALDREAFATAKVGPVRAHGDEAIVGVAVGATRGRAELSDDGERWRLVLPTG
jgi:hypothetical protein